MRPGAWGRDHPGAGDAGYGAAIVTDHYLPGMFEAPQARDLYLAGFYEARRIGDTIGFTVLPGMEFRFYGEDNDFLIYGMEEGGLRGPAGHPLFLFAGGLSRLLPHKRLAGVPGASVPLVVPRAGPRVSGRH